MQLFEAQNQNNWQAKSLLDEYKRQLQGAPAGPDSVNLSATVAERAAWVTPQLLEEILGDRLLKSAAIRDLNTTEEQIGQQLLRARGEYVAITNSLGEIEQIVNRQRFVDRTVRLLADQG